MVEKSLIDSDNRSGNEYKFYTSRSSIESYQRCPRYRYLHDYHNGAGIVPSSRSVPLTTGTCIHRGVEHLLGRLYLTDSFDQTDVDNACTLAVNEYVGLVEQAGFFGKGVSREVQQEYTFQEQKALTEALIRVWSIVEAPYLAQRFKVVGVERELLAPLPNSDVILQARVDGELQDRKDGSYYNYSLKTVKQFGEREERSYKRDLQGITEIYAVEKQGEVINAELDILDNHLDTLYDLSRISKLLDIRTFLSHKKVQPKRIMGIKFCFLVKGRFNPTESGANSSDSIHHTQSSLIRGYRNITPTGVNYAHSLYYPNPENKSGWGRLGKGWEEFDVWSDSEWNIKRWIELLASQSIQPDCGDVLKKYCVTPVEYFRDEEEIREAIEIISVQEKAIKHGLARIKCCEVFSEDNPDNPSFDSRRTIQIEFPKHRISCHYPTECEYNAVCWPGSVTNVPTTVSEDPVGSGYYQIRTPHHKKEKEEMERRIRENGGGMNVAGA